ncbi:MAG: ATP-binding protein [Cucumibacter sp.]
MPHSGRKKQSVLIVDDEAQVAIALADLLEEDFQVVTETSPLAALERLRASDDFSVIVSDQRMPGMSGDQLFAEAKELSIASRVLITGYADIGAVIDAVNQGKIYGYLTKPWKAEDIYFTVSRAAESADLNRKVLREQALLQQLMASSVDAIAIKDREHKYLRLNHAESRLLGAGEPRLVEGRSAGEFLPASRADATRAIEEQILTTGMPILDRLEQVTTRDERVRWFSSNLAPVHDDRREIVGLVSITRDVTEMRKLDEMKDQFIATVRHELRSPLTAMRGALSLLQSGAAGELSGQARRMIEISNRNCHDLLKLVNDLLETELLVNGRLDLDRSTFSVAELVAAAVAAARAMALDADVEVRAAPGLPDVAIDADRRRMLEVLDKLIANAVAAAPLGTTVNVSAEARDGRVRLTVADRGAGIPDDLREHVFKRFTQVDSSDSRPKGGVGLGLFIARSLVEAQGGTIDFASDETRGTVFFVDLPLALAAAVNC